MIAEGPGVWQRAMEQYCVLGRIGEGAHGIVFKAKHVEVSTQPFLLRFH